MKCFLKVLYMWYYYTLAHGLRRSVSYVSVM